MIYLVGVYIWLAKICHPLGAGGNICNRKKTCLCRLGSKTVVYLDIIEVCIIMSVRWSGKHSWLVVLNIKWNNCHHRSRLNILHFSEVQFVWLILRRFLKAMTLWWAEYKYYGSKQEVQNCWIFTALNWLLCTLFFRQYPLAFITKRHPPNFGDPWIKGKLYSCLCFEYSELMRVWCPSNGKLHSS